MSAVMEPERRAFLDAERAKWLTVEEAAYVLKTSHVIVKRAIREGGIVLLAVGKVWRIHVDSLPECQKIMSEWKS